MPIPVALALTSFDPGGTERQVTELIDRLDRHTFSVHAVCLRREGLWLARAEAAAVSVTEFRLHGFASASTARRLVQFAGWCRRQRIALVHACDFYANAFVLPGAALAGVPVRIGSRRDLRLPQRSDAQHLLQRHAYRCAHRIVANSEAAARQVVREGIREGCVSVIRNGVDAPPYAPRATRIGPPTITTVANLRPEKGHDTLIDAAAIVCARHPDARFTVAGDGSMRSELERRARERGVVDRVAFIGHCQDVPSLLADSDVFVLPSRTEALPNSLLEAMAAGVPSIASDVGGVPELIEHGVNGLLFPAGDRDALAAAILGLLNDRLRAAAFGDAARRTVVTRYSFERMTREFAALYLQELALRGRSYATAVVPVEPALAKPPHAVE